MWVFFLFVVGVTCDVNVVDNGISVRTTTVPNITIISVQDDQVNQDDDEGDEDDYIVETNHGRVKGFKDNSIIHYFDIPYGYFSTENPFQEPSAPESWENILYKTEHTSSCPQIDSHNNYIGNNECLTLSVFKPENTESADVLFHIHDSAFNAGSGNPSKYGPIHLAPHGVILVLPNYRLGPLGFLCMQNETAFGNAGLKDLTLALEWTKSNIKLFGGNDSNIVISGSGAAGALVEYLLLSNNSRSLISKAIVESGFVLSPWALDRQPLKTVKQFLEKLTNTSENTENSYNVLNQMGLENLVRAGQNINFRPCFKNETGFLTESPWFLLNNEKIGISVMSGSANQAAMDKALQETEESLSEINENCFLLLPDDLKFNDDNDRIRIGMEVKTQYFGENKITLSDLEKLSQCYSDSVYLYPGIRGARLLAKGGATVYFYEFSYGNNHPVNGAARGDILSFVFRDGAVENESDAMNSVKDIVIGLWVSFIKSGKPVSDNIEWKTLDASEESEESWLSIGNEVSVQKGFHQNRLKLWNEIYERHFIEHSLALKLNSSYYLILLCVLSALNHK